MTLVWLLALLFGVVLAVWPLTNRFGRDTGWIIAGVYLAAVVSIVPLMRQVLDGSVVQEQFTWVGGLDVELALRMDGLSLVFVLIALLVGAAVYAYSCRYLDHGRQLDFYVWMTAFTFAMVGLVVADDLVLLFLCWELTSLASFFLIARSGSGGEAASYRTLLLTFVGGLTLLVAVSATVVRTGTTNLTEALQSPVWQDSPGFASVIALLVLTSGFTKAAQFPFHSWLPDAMAAATPVSAYLHAAAVVKAGIYLMLRFSAAFHEVPVWNHMLIWVGLFTGALGAVFAFTKTDLKKLMAYSTVSQLGLITATIGIGTEKALAAATLHTIAHALFKSGLFMMVGVIDHAAHTRDIRRMPPLGRAMPWSLATTVLGCASMAGIPPMLGFVSKESIFTAMGEAPGPSWVGWAALAGAVGGAVLTFAYCAKIVFGAFVDGPRELDPQVREASPLMLVPAALPIWVGLPLALVVGVLDVPIGRAVEAMIPDAHEVHFAFWHGFNLELAMSAGVIATGLVIIAKRTALRSRLERDLLPGDGADAIGWVVGRFQRAGERLADLAEADHPTRHLIAPLVSLTVILLGGSWALASSGVLTAAQPGLWRWIDVVILALVVISVVGVAASDSRLGATVFLGGVGIAVTVQLFSLGAPDVGMTQLMVEMLTVVVIMLVLRRLPVRFGQPRRSFRRRALVLAVPTGIAAGVGTWVLTGRRPRSEIALYYLDETEPLTKGHNIVNVILVEFRALDTLGELSVLGMAGVAIIALLSTVGPRPENLRHEPTRVPLATRTRALRPFDGSVIEDPQAQVALTDTEANVMPVRLLLRVMVPLLAVVSALVFYRGHNEPGGGFIAALIGSAAVALVYLGAPTDRSIKTHRTGALLVAAGVATALLAGGLGLLDASFLAPLYADVGSQHFSTAMIFDLGVYLAVLGLFLVAVNLLGGPVEGQDTNNPGGDRAAGTDGDGGGAGLLEPEHAAASRRSAPARRGGAV